MLQKTFDVCENQPRHEERRDVATRHMKRPILAFMIILLGAAQGVCAQDDIEALLYSGIAAKRSTQAGLTELLQEAAAALKTSPNDYGLLWKYAALNYFQGEFYSTARDEKRKFATLCKDNADKAVKVNPKGIAGHYWLGVGMAKWAEYNGILYSLFTADDILHEMNIVIGLDPAFFKGLPWAIRASVYGMAPAIISVGDTAKARDDIITAMRYGKDNRSTYLTCADVYIALSDWSNAERLIDQGLALPYDPRL
jgi:hypothetical protein